MTDYRAVMDLVLKGWSVRQNRTTVGCSHTTVQKAREALEASGITTEAQLAGLSSESLAGLWQRQARRTGEQSSCIGSCQGQNGAAGAPVNQAPFNPAAPQQSSNSWQQPNQQNAGGWNQQPSGSGSTSWNQSSQQENGSNDWARPKASYDTDGSSGSADPEKNQ